MPTDWPHKQSEATHVGSEVRSVLELFPSGRPIVTTITRVRTNPTTCDHSIRMRMLCPLSRTPIGQTYLATEAINPPRLLIQRSRNWNQSLRRCRPDGNTKSAKSAKSPITNEPASTSFQALMNGMRVALVNVEGHVTFGSVGRRCQ